MITDIIKLPENNFSYQVQVSVNFFNGVGSVFLYSDQRVNLKGNLEYDNETSYWSMQFELLPGSHFMSIEAVDAKGLTSWVDIDPVIIESIETTTIPVSTTNDFIGETLLSLVCLIPVALYYFIKRKKGFISSDG